MFTKYENGAEVDIEEVYRYENGAEVEAEAVYAYKDGAEVEVWSAGVPPLGIYIPSSTALNKGVQLYIDGDTIHLDGYYVASSGLQSRIVIFVESEEPPTLSIDYVIVPGDEGLSGTIRLRTFTMGYNPKSSTFSNVADDSCIFEASIINGNTVEDIAYQFQTERTDGYYIVLCTQYTASNYNSTYSYWDIPVTIGGLRINGKKVVGHMDGIYELA